MINNRRENYVSFWVRNFLNDYLTRIKNNSNNTRKSYRDCFKLFIPYIALHVNKKIEKLMVEDITADNINLFLNYIQENRGCSISTRNQRLAAIYALSNYISIRCPELIEWNRQIHATYMKKISHKRNDDDIVPRLYYLEKEEMNAILRATDKGTKQGCRDYALLLFLYNSGARVSEATTLTIKDIQYNNSKASCAKVIIHGKGDKQRTCPLWENTIAAIMPLIKNRSPSESVFLNRYGDRITRHGVYDIVKKYARLASSSTPSIVSKRMSPHTIRHSTASHLLEAGVDINTIRAWLGHVSVDTTNIYAEVNMQMKAKALKTCEIKEISSKKHWKDDKDLMIFLTSL